MRRQDIQLLAAARAGDIQARCEVGRRYLLGEHGFPRHLATGIEHLRHASVRDSPCAQRTLADGLPPHELLAARLVQPLEQAARGGHVTAQIKAAACHLMAPHTWPQARLWLDVASEAGHPAARQACAAAQAGTDASMPGKDSVAAAAALRALHSAGQVDAVAMLGPALANASADADLPGLLWCLKLAEPWLTAPPHPFAEFVVTAILLCERHRQPFCALPAAQVERALQARSAQRDIHATYQLGRALAGLPCGEIPASALVAAGSLRKAAALLLRAADAGVQDAWMHLYRLSSDHRCTVANPQMARFFLEKSAAQGNTEAQRRLGTLLLRQAEDTTQTEQALHWLHCAREGGDPVAQLLLASLVLPVAGSDEGAEAALRVVHRMDPWLAARLSVARQFGLTRLEALALNPARGLRPWGLVVGPNPKVLKARLAGARAVPALSQQAMNCLRAAASLFNRHDAVDAAREADARQQARTLRTLFLRHGIDESLFFARATSKVLDTLRRGPRWAAQARKLVQEALPELH